MKKLLAILLASLMLLSLAACGGNPDTPGGPLDGPGTGDNTSEDTIEAFSVEAVQRYLKAYGMELSDLEPEWEWSLASKYSAYADNPSNGYGHAVIKFNRTEGELTDEQINDYFAAVFAATAAVSDDGHNIIGYEFAGDGEDALAATTLEDALGGWLQGWGFRRDGKCMVVYVSSGYDNSKESELDRLFYYNSVEFDIGVGLQKSFDDTLSDLEDYEDEIKDALEDFAD